jgi:hypothetical protein
MKLLNPVTFLLCRANSFRLALTAILIVGCVFAMKAHTEQKNSNQLAITPYNLSYAVTLGGVKIKATHQLKVEDDSYSHTVLAKSFLGEITESANFKLSETGNIIPLKYSKRHKTLMGNRSESQEFDWTSKILSYSIKNLSGKKDLLPGQFDRLSLNHQMRIDIAAGKKEFTHTIIRKGHPKQYQFRVLEYGIVNTSIGSFNGVLVERQGKSANRKAKIWLAADWDFIILKMEAFVNDSKRTMVLDQGQLNDKAILPLKHTAEI